MMFSLPVRLMAAAAIASRAPAAAAQSPLVEALDEALLTDLLQQYATYETSTCAAPAGATTFTFDWPGANPDSDWYGPFAPFEDDNFQALMSHNDTSDRSWNIRIGTSGNIYSHFAPDMWGETMPPQRHAQSPWIDEVLQSVAVNGNYNLKPAYPQFCTDVNGGDATCKRNYAHQAGAYQRDAPYTDVPFFSPSLAKHCSGNSCLFASWGTQAHVATPFTSSVMYINKYTNCGNGVIEHDQMIHNFADPNNPTNVPNFALNTDYNYFNVAWNGIRSSSLPYALEPGAKGVYADTSTLSYTDPNDVDFLRLCPWGQDGPEPGNDPPTWKGQRADINHLGGYTSFADNRLLLNQTFPPIEPYCRVNSIDCYATPNQCMVSSCSQAQIVAGTHTRIQLKVAPDSHPDCRYHSLFGDLVTLKCNMRDTGFGRTSPYLQGAEPCSPWTDIGFFNTRTGGVLPVAYIRHWSWRPQDRRVFFAVYSTNTAEAINMVNSAFWNKGSSEELLIDVRPTSNLESIPVGYNPSTYNAFTWVYGKGGDYGGMGGVSLGGRARRRIGSTAQGVGTRDFTVTTINWFASGATIQAGSTYVNRNYYINSDLGSVESTAEGLMAKTYADEIALELWSPRTVDIYEIGQTFVVKAASSTGGDTTSCNSTATLVCSGTSTPSTGRVPYFYMTCGTERYFGPNPYHFTPDFGSDFPNHGSISNPVRSYLCDGQDMSIRPTWKMMGFFSPTDPTCTALSTTEYEETVCDAGYIPPSASPTTSPTQVPSDSPSLTQVPSVSPSQDPSDAPSVVPSVSPSDMPSDLPSLTQGPSDAPSASTAPSKGPTASPTTSPTEFPTKSPTKNPTSSPSQSPTASPSDGPSASPSKGPSSSPTKDPSDAPSASPSSGPSMAPTSGPSASPSKAPSSSPTKGPSDAPSASPSSGPTKAPTSGPSASPSKGPSSSPTNGPSDAPSASPSSGPSMAPTSGPSASPSKAPSSSPTKGPSDAPSASPSSGPSTAPTSGPSASPSKAPSSSPTNSPSVSPSKAPSASPSSGPSKAPSPTSLPKDGWCSDNTGRCSASDMSECACNTVAARKLKGQEDRNIEMILRKLAKKPKTTPGPTQAATPQPTTSPTNAPTNNPTQAPSSSPTNSPTEPSPCTCLATAFPTSPPSGSPTEGPTSPPTVPQTSAPSAPPTNPPTAPPTVPVAQCICGDKTDKDSCNACGDVCKWSQRQCKPR